ncbi:MAG TPA: hypothetical protein PKI59_08490, partial [Candidatus Cloacimonadota bacterium]|nr:hypothetical protein [Candidatus Cloacimonadota bacterium]
MNSSRNIFTCLSIHGISSLLDLCHELSRESVTYVFALCVTFLYALYSIPILPEFFIRETRPGCFAPTLKTGGRVGNTWENPHQSRC